MIDAIQAAPSGSRIERSDLAARARTVAAVARSHAEDVDARARFPIEAVEAAKASRLWGAMAPADLGGEGATVSDIADVCFILGRACASTAMIFAMHQIKAACLIRHHGGAPWQTAFLRRLASEQLLLASSTTEGMSGGAVRESVAAVEMSHGEIRLDRRATVMSYGAEADAVVTTARRANDAPASDQVLIVFPRETVQLEKTSGWETLGMRGTCSLGFNMRARGEAAQIVPAPYADIHAQTMAPVAHLLWSSVWAGVAAEAVDRARLFVRKARAAGGQPPGAARLTGASARLHTLCAQVASSLARFEQVQDRPEALIAVDYQTAICLLKVEASEMAVAIVLEAMRVCGLSGYRTDGDTSFGRLLRDILSAPIMISNDRILASLESAALVDRAPSSIRG